MLYTTITVREKELKLRLDANMTVQIEKAIGKNPLNVVMGMNDGEMPKLGDLLTILWGALQKYNHGYTMTKVWELYDAYVADGKSMSDLVLVVMEIFKASGFIKEEEPEEYDENSEDDEKNA